MEKLHTVGVGSIHPAGGDWGVKYSPRTDTTGTQGLGPPAFMFVVSAKSVNWMAFYSLTQTTVNRGTEGQWKIPLCWDAEIDYLEGQFWTGCPSKPYASAFSSGAKYGKCFPMGRKVGKLWADECTTEHCCTGTECSAGYKAFGKPEDQGMKTVGCIDEKTENAPPGTVFYGPKDDPAVCGTSNSLGGCRSNSYFENMPDQEYLFSFVTDRDGIWGYRWKTGPDAHTEDWSGKVWPGISKYSAAKEISSIRPVQRPTHLTSPVTKEADYGVLFHPGGADDVACVQGKGDPEGFDGCSAVATVRGKNWWNYFVSTNQFWNYPSTITGQMMKDEELEGML